MPSFQRGGIEFQLTAARRRLATRRIIPIRHWSFNSQPPEGGWLCPKFLAPIRTGFNSQPPEGGWLVTPLGMMKLAQVSTHSRPKAAGSIPQTPRSIKMVSTHSRPKAAGIGFMIGRAV